MSYTNCLLTGGIAKGCKDNTGGLKRALIANKSEVTSFTSGTGASAGFITAITGATAQEWYEFTPNKQSSNWVENVQANVQNGTIGYEQVLTLMFAKNTAAMRNQISLLGQGETYIIIEDYNDTYWLMGQLNGVDLTGGNSGSGTAMSDMNGWTLTLAGAEPDPARQVESSIIAGLTIV